MIVDINATLAYDDPPQPGLVLESRVTTAKNQLLAFDAKHSVIMKDPNLSQRGREDALARLEPERAKLLALVEKVEEDARSLEFINTELEAAVFETPALDSTDHVGRADDGEIRQWYASLPEDRRRRELDKVVSGRNPRHALALARSPVPTVEAQIGLAALRANLPTKDRVTLREVEAQKAAIAWARSATGGMRNLLARRNDGPTA